MSKVTQAVIVDAGVSSRFLPVVKTIPKSFIPLGSKPTFQYLIEEALEAGLEDIIIVCRSETMPYFEDYLNNKREDLEKFLQDMGKDSRFDPVRKVLNFPTIRLTVQDPSLPYGTAAPIISAKELLKPGEPFVMIAGDDVVIGEKRDCSILVEEFEKDSSYSGYMTTEEITIDRVHLYGMVKTKGDNGDELDHIVEKPDPRNTPSLLASYGRFLYEYEIFDYMNPRRIGKDEELWNVDALTAMAHEKKVKVIKNQGKWMTTGDPFNYLKALIAYSAQDPEVKAQLKELLSD